MNRVIFTYLIIIWVLLLGALGLSILSTTTASEAAGATQVVNHTTLIEFLPDAPSGWTRQVEEWSKAEGTYNVRTNYAPETIDAYVSISDHGSSVSVQEFFEHPEFERVTKTVTVQGFQALELEGDSYYFLIVSVHNRFLVTISTNMDKGTLYQFVDLIDFEGIAALRDTVGKTQESQPVQHTELIEFLPDAPSGWVRQVEGLSAAEGTYNASSIPDFETIDAYVGILDYGSKVSDPEFRDRLPEPEGETKRVTIKGFQAREEYVKDVNYYILQVIIDNRFLVIITTTWDRDTLYYFADSIEYKELAAFAGATERKKMPGFEFGFVFIAVFAYILLKSSKGRD